MDRYFNPAAANGPGKLHGDGGVGTQARLDALLLPSEHFSYEKGQEPGRSLLQELRADPGRASLETVLAEIAKLEQVGALLLPLDLFAAFADGCEGHVNPYGLFRLDMNTRLAIETAEVVAN